MPDTDLSQVILGPMTPLVAGVVRAAIGDDVEVVHRKDLLRRARVDETEAPPVAIIDEQESEAADWERSLLLERPEIVVLSVHFDGQTLSARRLYPSTRDLGSLSKDRLVEAIHSPEPWKGRF